MTTAPRNNRVYSVWALCSIAISILFFGLFWMWQTKILSDEQSSTYQLIQSAPLSTTSQESSPFDISTLEASAINISIPSFSSLF